MQGKTILLSVMGVLALCLALTKAQAQQWYVSYSATDSTLLQINYGTAGNAPQYGALDTTSSYFRLNYGPQSGWGASIVVMPSYWSGGVYYQGYPVSVTWQVNTYNKLILTLKGVSNTLSVHATITLSPPGTSSISARVAAKVSGSLTLDNRPGEAFKPVFLSSMYDSSTVWDSSTAFVGTQAYPFPGSTGWIIAPSPQVTGKTFGLLGGTSSWKTNAPSVTITFARPYPVQVAGWLTADTNPNDDNVGLWAASATVLPSWSYKILVNGATKIP